MITVLTGLSQEARIFQHHGGLQVLCGAAQRDGLAKLVGPECEALVSAGCAGALAPDLEIGALAVGTLVTLLDGTKYYPPATWLHRVGLITRAEPRPFFSCPTEQCATAAERAALRKKFTADMVDEESFAIAALGHARRLPWLVLRAISDTADQDVLPGDAAAMRPDGTEDIGPIIGDALRDPIEAIREGAGFAAAMQALRVAFGQLGPRFGLPA